MESIDITISMPQKSTETIAVESIVLEGEIMVLEGDEIEIMLDTNRIGHTDLDIMKVLKGPRLEEESGDKVIDESETVKQMSY